jgi:hypothetical protein
VISILSLVKVGVIGHVLRRSETKKVEIDSGFSLGAGLASDENVARNERQELIRGDNCRYEKIVQENEIKGRRKPMGIFSTSLLRYCKCTGSIYTASVEEEK